MTDTLFYYTQNKAPSVRFADMIKPKPVDNRSADEMVADVIKKAGLSLIESEVKHDDI